MPDPGRLIDPTIQQFAEVPATDFDALPVLLPIPPGRLPGGQQLGAVRAEQMVVYTILPDEQRDRWFDGVTALTDVGYIRAGAWYAANALGLMSVLPQSEPTPYPRLNALLEQTSVRTLRPIAARPIGNTWPELIFDGADGTELRPFEPPW